jgi:hypothetical protein
VVADLGALFDDGDLGLEFGLGALVVLVDEVLEVDGASQVRGARPDQQHVLLHHFAFNVHRLFLDSGFRSQVSGYRSQASGGRAQASGFRLQVSGFRFQVSGFRAQWAGADN